MIPSRPPLCDAVDPRIDAGAAGTQVVGEWAQRSINGHMRARCCPVDFGPRWLRERVARALALGFRLTTRR